MVKDLVKLSFKTHAVDESDMLLVQANPIALDHFKKSKQELERMAKTKFYDCWSYYSILKMSKNLKKSIFFDK